MLFDLPFNAADLKAGVEKMNSFGIRTTGSPAHNAFVGYIKEQISDLGFVPESDYKLFERWEARRASLTIHSKEGDIPVHVSSPFPYSGETDENGVTAKCELVLGKHINYLKAKDKIAVVKVKDFKSVYSGIAFNQKKAFPKDLKIPRYYKGPVASAFVKFPFLEVAATMGVKVVICIWEDMSDAMVEGQYLNFILGYQGVPAVWVNEHDGKLILEACNRNDSVTLTLEADKEKNAVGETVYTVCEGENKEECIIINTHTDGVNCVEENGPVALLNMLKYFKEHKPQRTLVFVFTAGHFRLPEFKAPNAVNDQATSLWIYNHKELWDGKDGHLKAVAGLTVEHLGCREWKDFYGEYKCTNPVDIEVVYTGNREMDKIYFESIKGREKVRTVTLRGHNFLHFGEGQSLFNVGIPEIALVTSPDYLCVESESHEMEKFDEELMLEQTESFIKMVDLINERSAEQLGRADIYSFGLGKI